MIRFLKYLILIPFVIIFVGFMLANRHSVVLNIDPFNAQTPFMALEIPLYIIMIAAVIVGALFGGIADWLNQGRHRKTARSASRKNRELIRETERLKDHIATQTKASLISSSSKS